MITNPMVELLKKSRTKKRAHVFSPLYIFSKVASYWDFNSNGQMDGMPMSFGWQPTKRPVGLTAAGFCFRNPELVMILWVVGCCIYLAKKASKIAGGLSI